MEVVRGLVASPRWNKAVIAIGNFDGVHLGHRALIDRAVDRAREISGTSVAVTFDPHPTAVVAPTRAPALLTTVDRRLQWLAQTDIDAVVVLPFNAELAELTPEQFVDRVLREQLGAAHVVVGYDFGYGRGRSGSARTLADHGERAGFRVDVVEAVTVAGRIASSTAIRGRLREGDLAGARELLGHAYDVDGVVVHGAKRGRVLGFPTANVEPELPLIVGSGIYACRLSVLTAQGAPSDALPAVASLGTNPTFVTAGTRTLEVFVLDWSGDLYDRRVRVELVSKLRDEARFGSVEELVAQIARDVADARAALTTG